MLADVSLIYLITFFVHLITRRCFCGTPDYIFCPLDYMQMYKNYNLLHYINFALLTNQTIRINLISCSFHVFCTIVILDSSIDSVVSSSVKW